MADSPTLSGALCAASAPWRAAAAQPVPRVLVVDDDAALRGLLTEYLAEHGLNTAGAATAAEAEREFAARTYDLVLLDLGLPDRDGIELARSWREASDAGIICVSARSEQADIVMGLELAADDYVVKPFAMRELLARMRAVLRRSRAAQRSVLRRVRHPRAYRFADWILNLNTRRLHGGGGSEVVLTNAEFNLLVVFLGAPGRILSRDQLLASTRAFDDIFDRAIDVQVLRLRRKLEVQPQRPRLLRTLRGAGYLFEADVDVLWD